MRWVILTDDALPQRGGIATWTGWAERALAAEHQVQVFARRRPGLAPSIRGVKVPSHGRFGPLATTLVAARALRRADAALCTTWPYARFVHRVAPELPVHVVAHGSGVTQDPRPLLERVWKRAAGRWAVSRYLAGVLASRGIEAKPLPIPIPTAAPATGGERWVFVARATSLKGGERFLRLVAAAGVAATVVGDGPALDDWRHLAERLGAEVRFLGGQGPAGVEHALSQARLLALLPRTASDGTGAEGLGLVLLEARARGIPVVGCATGGVPEAVGEGLVLTDPDDVPRSLEQIRGLPRRADVTRLRREHSPQRFRELLCG